MKKHVRQTVLLHNLPSVNVQNAMHKFFGRKHELQPLCGHNEKRMRSMKQNILQEISEPATNQGLTEKRWEHISEPQHVYMKRSKCHGTSVINM